MNRSRGTLLLLGLVLALSVVVGSIEAKRTKNSVPVVVALKERNLDLLRERFWAVSNPLHEDYGKFMSLEELTKLSAPTEEAIRETKEWLMANGASNIRLTKAKDFIYCDLELRSDLKEEELPINPFSLEKHLDVSHPTFRAHIQFASPLTSIFESESAMDEELNWSVRDHPVQGLFKVQAGECDPNTQRVYYEVPKDVPTANSSNGNSQMVWGTGTYGISMSDLKQFYNKFDINNPPSNVKPIGFNGDSSGDNFGEATLDTQYISGIAPQILTYVFNSNNTPSTESGAGFGPAFLDFVVTLGSSSNDADSSVPFPYVLSISLGSLSWVSCDRLCQNVSASSDVSYEECLNYAQSQFQVCMYTSSEQTERISDEFMELGLRGMSIMAAAGDGGCHFSFGPFPETSAIGRALNKFSCEQAMPTFPAESPYVVAVGGSQMLTTSANRTLHPVFCSSTTGCIVTGGGGFSWQFAQPSYQASFVNQYLEGNSPNMQFNAQGRGYPDVSTIATDVPVVLNGGVQIVGGTSASAPEMAALVSLINDWRLSRGMTPLGFINPALYLLASSSASGSAFYDITEGNSRCGYSSGPVSCCSEGFESTPGWDAASGWGQPRWGGLFTAFTTPSFFESLGK